MEQKKYKLHIVDVESDGKAIYRLIVTEEQKKVLDYFEKQELIPELLRLDYSETESNYTDLT